MSLPLQWVIPCVETESEKGMKYVTVEVYRSVHTLIKLHGALCGGYNMWVL